MAILGADHLEPSRLDVLLDPALRHGANPNPRQQGIPLLAHGADGEARLLVEQTVGKHRLAQRRIGHRDGAVTAQGFVRQGLGFLVERMIRVGDIEHHLLPEQLVLDAGHHDVGIEGGDEQIGAIILQTLPAARQHLGPQPQPGIGQLGQPFHQRVERLHRHQRIDGDGDVGLPATGQGPGLAHQMLGCFQEHPAPFQQHATGRGEFGSVTAAVEQHGVQLVFQLLYRVAQRRGHLAQLVGRRRKAAAAIDGVQHPDRLQGQRPFLIQFLGHSLPSIFLNMFASLSR